MSFNNKTNKKELITNLEQLRAYCLSTVDNINFFKNKFSAMQERIANKDLSSTMEFQQELTLIEVSLRSIKSAINSCLEENNKSNIIPHNKMEVLKAEINSFNKKWKNIEKKQLEDAYKNCNFYHQNGANKRLFGQILLGISAILTLGLSLVAKGFYTKYKTGRFSIFTNKTNTQLSGENTLNNFLNNVEKIKPPTFNR